MADIQADPQSEPLPRPVRVLIVQDHPLLASAIAKVFDAHSDFTVSGVAGSGADALKAAEQAPPMWSSWTTASLI